MTRSTVTDPHAPVPVGPYSHAARHPSGPLFVSGQAAIDPTTGALSGTGVAEQTRQVFANLSSVLAAAGLTLDDVVKVNVYLANIDDFAEMNGVYEDVFSAPYPARTTVAVAALPIGARIEIELVA